MLSFGATYALYRVFSIQSRVNITHAYMILHTSALSSLSPVFLASSHFFSFLTDTLTRCRLCLHTFKYNERRFRSVCGENEHWKVNSNHRRFSLTCYASVCLSVCMHYYMRTHDHAALYLKQLTLSCVCASLGSRRVNIYTFAYIHIIYINSNAI